MLPSINAPTQRQQEEQVARKIPVPSTSVGNPWRHLWCMVVKGWLTPVVFRNQTRRDALPAPVIPLLCSRTVSHVVCTSELCHGRQEEAHRSALHLSITAPLTWLSTKTWAPPSPPRRIVVDLPTPWTFRHARYRGSNTSFVITETHALLYCCIDLIRYHSKKVGEWLRYEVPFPMRRSASNITRGGSVWSSVAMATHPAERSGCHSPFTRRQRDCARGSITSSSLNPDIF